MNEAHLRRLSVTMRRLEDALGEVAASLKRSSEMIMTSFAQDVPKSVQPAISEKILQIENEIRITKDRYNLERQVVSNRRQLNAKLSLLSIDLTEATSRHMRSFGEVPQDEQGALDAQMTKISTMLEGLIELINRVN